MINLNTNKKLKKVAFIDVFYGGPKGHSYVNRDLLKVIGEKCETHMFRLGNNPLPEEFPLPDGKFDSYEIKNGSIPEIPKDLFIKWLDEVKPDYCVFNEYGQWWDCSYDKLEVCKERGIKTIGYLVWEKLDWNKLYHYRKYWKIIVPSKFQTKLMRKKGLFNTVQFTYGVFFDEIEKVIKPQKNQNKVIFYHCAGSGGVNNRKNTDKVIEAYKMIEDETTELRITHLSKKVFGRDEILSFTKGADVLINVSKHETIGLNSIESNACGIPVIVADGEPMNEYIKHKINGLCVKGSKSKSDLVTCTEIDVNVDELAKAMMICKNREILNCLQNNAYIYSKKNFDWNVNKKDILKLFEE